MATTEVNIPRYPFFLQEQPSSTNPIYYSAEDFRNYTGAIHGRAGILGLSHFKVTQADTVGFKVKVKSGYCNVGGKYIVYLPTATEIDMPWAKPASGTVTHKIWVAVYDNYIAGTTNIARLVATQDTGGGALPPPGAAATLELGTATVSATQPNIQNANIVNTAQHGGGAETYVDLGPYLSWGMVGGGSTGHTNNPRAIYNNGFIHLSGRIDRFDSGGYTTFAADTDITIMNLTPTDLVPRYNRYITGSCDANSGASGLGMTFRITIANNGIVIARIPTGQHPRFLTLDGIIYDLD